MKVRREGRVMRKYTGEDTYNRILEAAADVGHK